VEVTLVAASIVARAVALVVAKSVTVVVAKSVTVVVAKSVALVAALVVARAVAPVLAPVRGSNFPRPAIRTGREGGAWRDEETYKITFGIGSVHRACEPEAVEIGMIEGDVETPVGCTALVGIKSKRSTTSHAFGRVRGGYTGRVSFRGVGK
jgi:hypothetical protein